jgi:AraC-type transcriptional regulator
VHVLVEAQLTAGPQHAVRLSQGGRLIWHGAQHERREDGVDRPIPDGQILRRPGLDPDRHGRLAGDLFGLGAKPRLGLDRDDLGHCLRRTGITRGTLDDPAGEIRSRQELAVARNIVRALGDPPGLGLEAGSRYHLTTYGIWGFALISSSTLREAISAGLSFLELTYTFVDIRTEERAGELLFVLDDELVPEDVKRFMVERDAAAIMIIQRELFGRSIALRRVAFRYPRPDDSKPYEEIFGTRPEFGARQNVAAIDAAVLDLPLPQASPYAAQLSQQQCRELLDRAASASASPEGSAMSSS